MGNIQNDIGQTQVFSHNTLQTYFLFPHEPFDKMVVFSIRNEWHTVQQICSAVTAVLGCSGSSFWSPPKYETLLLPFQTYPTSWRWSPQTLFLVLNYKLSYLSNQQLLSCLKRHSKEINVVVQADADCWRDISTKWFMSFWNFCYSSDFESWAPWWLLNAGPGIKACSFFNHPACTVQKARCLRNRI